MYTIALKADQAGNQGHEQSDALIQMGVQVELRLNGLDGTKSNEVYELQREADGRASERARGLTQERWSLHISIKST